MNAPFKEGKKVKKNRILKTRRFVKRWGNTQITGNIMRYALNDVERNCGETVTEFRDYPDILAMVF